MNLDLYKTLQLLSVGLHRQLNHGSEQHSALRPNEYLRKGWETLSCLMYEHRVKPPSTIPELVMWCKKPLEYSLGVTPNFTQLGLRGPLLEDDGYLTDLGRELAEKLEGASDVLLEQDDEYFRAVFQFARENKLSKDYAEARNFTIRNPVLDDPLDISSRLDWHEGIRSRLLACYEPFDSGNKQREGSKVFYYTCPRCGWPLHWKSDEAQCYKDGPCRAWEGELAENAVRMPYADHIWRTREGVQRYVVGAEVELIRLADLLKRERGLTIALFPNLDAYDMQITFPDNKSWAIDLKNYKSATQLAKSLRDKAVPGVPLWERAFYVFPDERATDGYLTEFGNVWKAQQGVWFLNVSQLIARVQERLNR